MTSISYEEIFDNFLGRVSDYDFSFMDESSVNYLMSEYLQKVLSRPYVHRLFSFIDSDAEIHLLKYEMKKPVDDYTDKNFVIDILSKGMVVEWIEPQVRNKVNLSQFFGGKEQKFYSQSNHISELRAILEDTEIALRKEIRDRGSFYNSYLEES